MDNRDKPAFQELMNAACEYYQKPVFSKIALQMYFSGLDRFEYQQVKDAISSHISVGPNGQYLPKVSDLAKLIEGGTLTTDEILAAARICETPLGILSNIVIGSYDLKNSTDMFYMKQRAEECLQHLPRWKLGEYTEHEISIMLKYGVDPTQPLFKGIQRPKNHKLIAQYANDIKTTGRHLRLIAPPEENYLVEPTEEQKKNMLDTLKRIMDDEP